MPDVLHPPYGVVTPRRLTRWLDVNSQNGPLDRSRYAIYVPEYDLAYESLELKIDNDWEHGEYVGMPFSYGMVNLMEPGWFYYYLKGDSVELNANLIWGEHRQTETEINETGSFFFIASSNGVGPGIYPALLGTISLAGQHITASVKQVLPQIVRIYEYNANRKFSLNAFRVTNIDDIGTIFIACPTTGVKYLLNYDSKNPVLGSPTEYTNQLIEANFRIEIWTSVGNVTSNPFLLETTLKTNLDYRYDPDTNIFPTNTIDEFGSVFPIIEPPIVPDNVLIDPQGNVIVDPDGNPITTL